MGTNYQIELEKVISKLQDKPRLLLHTCCAPCSSYCLEYLSEYFDITVFYYNPNIVDETEYDMRVNEQIRLVNEMNKKHGLNIKALVGRHDSDVFLEKVKGLEHLPEGHEICRICFEMRLYEAARYAKDNSFDYYTTSLTISPLKNAAVLNEVGQRMANEAGVKFLPSDFKKKNGYKRSIELSHEYNLYRQNYCGCPFSKRDAMQREERLMENKNT